MGRTLCNLDMPGVDIVFYLGVGQSPIIINNYSDCRSRFGLLRHHGLDRIMNHNGHLISSRCHITVHVYRSIIYVY